MLVLWIKTGVVAQKPLQFTFQKYTTADGLSSNQTNTIVQDHQGYLWIGTTNGLQRYDGIRFRSFKYQPGDSTSLPSNPVMHLKIDHQGRLWVLMEDGRVGIFDTELFKYRDVSVKGETGKGKYERGKSIIIDHDGNIYLLLDRKELYIWNDTSFIFTKAFAFLPQTPEWRIESFAHQPGTKKYWFGLIQGGFAIYNALTRQISYPGQNIEKEPFLDRYKDIDSPYNLYFDRSGRLWFMDWPHFTPYIYCWDTGLAKPKLEKVEFNSTLKRYIEMAPFFEQRNGTIWTYGSKVLARFNEEQGIFEHVETAAAFGRGIDFSIVTSLLEDREKNIWITTDNNGLFRFNEELEYFMNVKHQNRNTGLPGNGSPMSFIELDDRSVFVGIWGDGLYRYDQEWNLLPVGLQDVDEKHVSVWSMFASRRSQDIWLVGQPSSIIHYDQEKQRTKSYYPEVLQKRTIRQVVEDINGHLWLGTHGAGLYKMSISGGKDLFANGLEKYPEIPNTIINHLSVDSKDQIWIATPKDGLYVINPASDNIVEHLTLEGKPGKRLPEEGVSSTLEYNDSLTIVGTLSYLLMYNQNTDSISILAGPQNLSGYLTALQKDWQGYLWFTTSSGLYRMNVASKALVRFDSRDGLGDERFTLVSSYQIQDGRLIFGASDQFIVFDPQKIHLESDSVKLLITGLQVMNKPVVLDSLTLANPIKLKYKANAINIEYSPLTYATIYKVKYKMEGLDEEWQASSSYSAVYSYLPPGVYTFRLYANDVEGKPGKMSSITIEVASPFWATWWFYSIVALVLLGLLYWFDTERLKRREAVYAMRMEIATKLHKEIDVALNSINILSEMARIKSKDYASKANEYIEQINTKSQNMIIAMDDMLWVIRPENDRLNKVVERFEEYLEALKTQPETYIDLLIGNKIGDQKLDMKQRQMALRLFKGGINNVLKTGGNHCQVHINVEKAHIIYNIEFNSTKLDIQRLNNLLQREELNIYLDSINGVITSDIHQTKSHILLKIPLAS